MRPWPGAWPVLDLRREGRPVSLHESELVAGVELAGIATGDQPEQRAVLRDLFLGHPLRGSRRRVRREAVEFGLGGGELRLEIGLACGRGRAGGGWRRCA